MLALAPAASRKPFIKAVTTSVSSSSAGLFVGPLSNVPNLCNANWSAIGVAVAAPSCSYQLTTATNDQHGEMVWPYLISTGDIQISFSVTFSNPSALPADGFTVLLADPSLQPPVWELSEWA